jgi:hypothetical protein
MAGWRRATLPPVAQGVTCAVGSGCMGRRRHAGTCAGTGANLVSARMTPSMKQGCRITLGPLRSLNRALRRLCSLNQSVQRQMFVALSQSKQHALEFGAQCRYVLVGPLAQSHDDIAHDGT